MKKISLLFLFVLMTSSLFAQSNLKVDAQIRPRFEMNAKDFNGDTSPFTYTLLRTRLGAKFTPVNNLTGYIQLQDSRVFGEEPSTMTDMEKVDIHQAFFKIDKLFKLPLSVKAGRMEVKYSNERLLGAVGWSNISRSFDGAIAGLSFDKVNVDVLALQEKESLQPGDSLDQSVYGTYFDLKLSKKYKIQPFWIHQTQVSTDNLNRSTLGIYVKGNMDSFWHEVEAAYQLGTITDGTKKDVSAYMVAVNLGYKFNTDIKPWISAGIDYLSGDDGKDAGKYKVFNTLYATNHKFYGYMDYFVNIPKNTYGKGLMDLHGKVGASFNSKFSGGINFHVFNSAADYTLKNGSTATDFGMETDLTLKYKYNKKATFIVGFSVFNPGEIFKETRGSDMSSWGYLMAVVNL